MSMKRNYFVFDGKNSADFGAWIATSNMFDGAAHDDETVEIPGRNGALVYSNGRWKNFEAEVNCYMPYDMQTNVDGLRAFLSVRHGYCRYEEALKPEEYRLARYVGPFSLSESDRVGAAFTLSFDCKPQRFLKSGELPVTLTTSSAIYNPTLFEAKPLIRCYGTSGRLVINDIGIRVTGCSSYVDIDCELMEAYEGSTSRNSTTTLEDGEFPTIPAGSHMVYFSGWSSVVIYPRWWTI